MTVHFVYRSHYQGPMGLYHKAFAERTVLEWFQNHWEGIPYDEETAYGGQDRVAEVLGCSVYGFNSLFNAIARHALSPPRTERRLVELLRQHLYLEGELRAAPHLLQMLTDDDEIELAYYFFDDEYL